MRKNRKENIALDKIGKIKKNKCVKIRKKKHEGLHE